MLNGMDSDCQNGGQVLERFTTLELDIFHALCNLNYPDRDHARPTPARNPPAPHLREGDLWFSPIGTLIEEPHNGRVLQGQVYEVSGRHWRARSADNDWCEKSW